VNACETGECSKDKSRPAEEFESTDRHPGNIRGKSEAQHVDEVDDSVGMAQAHDVAWACPPSEDGFDGIPGALIREVAEETVTCTKGEKSQRRWFCDGTVREETVQDFEGRAITSDANKTPASTRVRFSDKMFGVAGGVCFDNVKLQAGGAQLSQRGTCEFSALSLPGGGIHDGHEGRVHRCRLVCKCGTRRVRDVYLWLVGSPL
jgi:hypothetical protein